MANSHGTNQPRVLLTVEQAAKRLSLGRTTVYGLLKDGELYSVQVGRLRRIPAESVDSYVDRLSQRQ